MVPSLKVIPQWSCKMSSRLIKGWKGEKGKSGSLRRWSRQMSFKKSSSKVQREIPLGGVTRQDKKVFGIAFHSIVRVRKRIQNPPW